MTGNQFEPDQNSAEHGLARLMTIYMPYIQKRAARLRIPGLDTEDLVQEGLVGLFRAVETYDAQKGESFSNYAVACIRNGINTAVRQALRKKHQPLKSYLSLSDGLEEETLVDADSPEELAIRTEEYDAVMSRIKVELSDMERNVLELYLKGYDYLAVAKQLDTTPKSVDNALQRARKKLKSKQ